MELGTLIFKVEVTGIKADGTKLTDGDSISNTAYVNGDKTDTTETTIKSPDITISKTASKTVNAGENIEYKIVISNNESTPETVTISESISGHNLC